MKLDGTQGRKQVWRPQHVWNWGFRKQMYRSEKSTCNIVGTFRRPRGDSAPTRWLGTRGIVPAMSPSLQTWEHSGKNNYRAY